MFNLTPVSRVKKDDQESDNFVSLFDYFFNDGSITSGFGNFKMDVKEKDGYYIIEAELPGIKKEDISLEYHDERLKISVCEKEECKKEDANIIHSERRFSSMSREVYLGEIDLKDLDASLNDGVLKIKTKRLKTPDEKVKIDIK